MSGEGTDSGTRVVQHPGPPVPEGLAELDGGQGQDPQAPLLLKGWRSWTGGGARTPRPPCS